MSVEVKVCVEGRKVALDIEPNDMKGLKKEFDEWCEDDEAMVRRRQAYAPIFFMTNIDSDQKTEIKRKYNFKGGEEIYVSWTPLQLEEPSASERQGTSGSTRQLQLEIPSASERLPSGFTQQLPSVSRISTPIKISEGPSDFLSAESLNYKSTIFGVSTNKTVPDIVESKDLSQSLSSSSFDSDPVDESEDNEDYGEVREYFTDAQWARIPKYLKSREKSRFELHEHQNKEAKKADPNFNLKPFQPDVMLKELGKHNKRKKSTKSKPGSKQRSVENGKPFQFHNTAGKKETRTPLKSLGSNSQPSQSHSDQVIRLSSKTPQPGPSTGNRDSFDHEELLKLKPTLPHYDIGAILQELYLEGNDKLKEQIDKLNRDGILYKNDRASIVRLLTRHLFYKIANQPTDVSADMREGLAKSIVLEYPKFQVRSDGVTTYPWNALFERGNGRGWIANSARSIQSKFRTRKSKKRKSSATVSVDVDDPAPSVTNQAIESMALLMPGRSEKSTIINGMKGTFKIRQNDRKNQMPVGQMLKKYPHLISYDGEILQEEYKLLHPSSNDLCKNFLKHIPGILTLPSCSATIPFEDDSIKALVLLANSLPRDKRSKGDPKSKSLNFDLKDLIEVVQLGQDIDLFVCDKIEESESSIQPYLILVKSPLYNNITRFFLVLDQKAMQIASGSIMKAIDVLFKSYFVFNVQYPLGWRNTFHFLATCFANVFEQGQKSRPDIVTPSEQELLKKISLN